MSNVAIKRKRTIFPSLYQQIAQTSFTHLKRAEHGHTYNSTSHTHTHIPTGEQLCWQLTQIIVDYNRATNKQHLYNGRGDSLNKLGVEILGPIIHCPLKEMKEIKEKKKENSKYIYKFDGRHNTLSTYPHSRRGWKRVDQQLEEDASLLFHLLCFMSQFLSV